MPRRLAQQRMTLSDPEWPFHASRAISAVAELFYFFVVGRPKKSYLPPRLFISFSFIFLTFFRQLPLVVTERYSSK